ncbi:RNA polymerase sigma-70 factor (ECF subfamily) [Kribbella sp. VKM Ac-2527]|uniref:RNA polymerase sigma-70 factor (ECF subfamily) n=1 Tax=Kribbella caucasensis TaxID=2512215 RepID=A0A4R6KJD9_9ACTN|nr:RNA polymerase sigma factor [Kribbella sp. VKM Ac-2527]TDO50582.1 RNA polymerase sigma-70 factor (ECF subfamily) [Kribbella sp. VKM Ac-2527]
MSTPTDSDLLRNIAAGDEAALRQLYERHAGWLLLRLKRRCGNPDLVAGALQDTFVAVWKSAGRYRGEGDVAAWLWGISIRRLVSALRGRPAADPLGDEVISAATPLVHSAEDELLLGVEYGDVGWALRTLPPELRATVQATVIDGLTAKEAAKLLGLPQGTVKSRLRVAKVQLRERLMPARDGRI